jgi:hypothetical protein
MAGPQVRKSILTVVAAILIVLTSCMASPDRLSNQGGGTVLSAVAKVASDDLTSLTPDEIQLLAEGVEDLLPDIDLPPLTDEQAQAVVDLLDEFDLDSLDDVAVFIEQVSQGQVDIDPDVIDILAGLVNV